MSKIQEAIEKRILDLQERKTLTPYTDGQLASLNYVLSLLAEAEKESACPTCKGKKEMNPGNYCPDCNGEGTYRAWVSEKFNYYLKNWNDTARDLARAENKLDEQQKLIEQLKKEADLAKIKTLHRISDKGEKHVNGSRTKDRVRSDQGEV